MHKIVWLKPFPCMICFIVWMHDEFTLCGRLFKLCWFLRAVIQGSSPCITQDVKSTETGFLEDITSENFVQSHFSRKEKLLFEDESFCADKNTRFFAFEVYFAWLQPSLPDFCRLCVLCSRDKVQPLTRVPVRATRNVKKWEMVSGQREMLTFRR